MQALIVAALVAAAAASGIGPALSGARGVALPAVAGRGYGAARHGYADDYAEPRPYHYQYAVDDPHYGPMFKKEEQSDGAGNVQGYYAVNLPDGRTQHVKYVADGYNGFNAEVTYDGYANHPEVARGYGYGAGRGVAGVVGHAGAGHGVVSGGLGLVERRGYGYGAGRGVAGVVGHAGAGRVVASGGLGPVGRRVGGYGAGAGLANAGAGLLGGRAGPTPLSYGLAGPKPLAYGRAGPKPLAYGRAGPKPLAYGRAGSKPLAYGRAGPKPLAYGRAGPKPLAYGRAGPTPLAYGRAGPTPLAYGH